MKNSNKEYLLKVLQSNWKTFILFIVVSILFRFLSFFYGVIDDDESTYLIIANALNNGSHLYTDVIDTKPPGIFIAFSIVQLVFGKSVLAIRFFGSLILSLSAFLIFKTSKRFGATNSISFVSGLIYILMFSMYRFGLAVNTELFFSFFALLGLSIFQIAEIRNKPYLWFLGGLVVGIGFLFKYVILAGFGAFCIFFLAEKEFFNDLKSKVVKLLVATFGVFLPFLLVHLYFLLNGRFDDFYEIIYNVTGRYSSDFSLSNSAKFILNFHLSYLPFIAVFYYGLLNKNIPAKVKTLSVLWFLFAVVMVVLPGKPFKHYYLQILPSMCFIIPLAIQEIIIRYQYLKTKKASLMGGILSILFIASVVNQSYFWYTTDVTAEVAAILKDKVQPSDVIVTDKKLQLTYYLLDLSPPSKYVHPSIIIDHTEAFAVTTEEEMNKMFDKKPKYIVYQISRDYYESNTRLLNNYHLFDEIDKVKILEINSVNH